MESPSAESSPSVESSRSQVSCSHRHRKIFGAFFFKRAFCFPKNNILHVTERPTQPSQLDRSRWTSWHVRRGPKGVTMRPPRLAYGSTLLAVRGHARAAGLTHQLRNFSGSAGTVADNHSASTAGLQSARGTEALQHGEAWPPSSLTSRWQFKMP